MKKNILRAMLYIVIGTIVEICSISFSLYMYFSATFLAYKYVQRKIIYLLLLIIMIVAAWFIYEGCNYIERRIKRK